MTQSTAGRLWPAYRSVPIVYRLAVAFVVGAVVGLAFGERATVVQPFGDLFLRLLGMLVMPLVVFTILTGIRRLSPTKIGRIGTLSCRQTEMNRFTIG